MLRKNGLYRRNGKKVYIKQPELNELGFTSKLWADQETMAEIGGAYNFSREKWEPFYKKMVEPTDGKNFYCLIYTVRDKAIGEVSFHGYDSSTKAARINIKVHHRYRNKGYGEEALKLLLEFYFYEFGGVAIIDTVKTQGAKKILEKLGFAAIGNFKNEITYKITKDTFSIGHIEQKKNIAVIGYEGMDIMEYVTPFKVFELTNEIIGEEVFTVYGVSGQEKITTNSNIKIYNDVLFDNEEIKPDIIIIPGGNDVDEAVKDKQLIKYLMSNYNDCDYLLAFSNSVHFLNRCRMLEGLLLPNIKEESDKTELSSVDIRWTEEKFTDNGKILLSSNSVGAINICCIIIKKMLGEDIYKKISNKVGT